MEQWNVVEWNNLKRGNNRVELSEVEWNNMKWSWGVH